MSKQFIIKWCKRVGIAIGSVAAILLLWGLSLYIYYDYYIPHHIESLYQEGLDNPNKAKGIISELEDIEPCPYSNQSKYLQLIKHYADKKEQWAQVMSEQYNNEQGITLISSIPINKHIWDITLGKSTKQDVWNYLDSKSLWHQEIEDGSITKAYTSFEFVGIFWNAAYCYFSNNIVYKITFMYKNEGSPKEAFDRLKYMLATKYTLSKNFNDSKCTFSLKDSCTLVELEIDSDMKLTLEYTDTKIKNEKLQQDINSI